MDSFVSKKYLTNRVSTNPFTDVDLNKLFFLPSNLHRLHHDFNRIAHSNGNKCRDYDFIVQCAEQFAAKDLNKYKMAEEGTSIINWVETLKAINQDFMKYLYTYIKWNSFLPTRMWLNVNDVQKKAHCLLTEDYNELDVWRNQEVKRVNSMFRYNNMIPPWQYTMHIRHPDKSNEGFHHDDYRRASLETPLYSYDMSTIHKTLDKWEDVEWFGM